MPKLGSEKASPLGFFRALWPRQRAKVLPHTIYRAFLQCTEHEPYGISVSGHPKLRALVVLDTSKSRAVEQWNSAHPEQKIEAGHVILEVNGARDPRRMLRQLRKSSKVEILMNKQPSPEQVCVFQAALELRRKPALPTVEEGLEVTSPCASVEPCYICHEDLEPKASDHVELPCGQEFHRICS
ncbi:unnamed protein product [Durusdinium trenchii]|uniref:RING-type domain-containing protein n=1 Tax=Durusdinium trenchii TaxID=1381693 RepID=A0ABP0MAG7_9DINO